MPKALLVAASFSALAGMILLIAGLKGLASKKFLGGLLAGGVGAGLLVVGGLGLSAWFGLDGFQELTQGKTVAMITTEDTGSGSFIANFRFKNGAERSFDLEGDHLYVDGQILKWHPSLHGLGLQDGYRLARVSGQLSGAEGALAGQRLVSTAKFDFFTLARSLPALRPVVQAQPAATSYRRSITPAQYELVVTDAGLALRRIGGVVK